MNNGSFLFKPILFAGGGVVAGFVSLIAAVIVDIFLPSQGGYFSIFVLVLVEESAKLGGLAILLMYEGMWTSPKSWQILFAALFFGLGFGAFELLLIFLNVGSVPRSAFAVGYVHLATSVFLFFAIHVIKNLKRETFGYFLILLAVLIHLCYNIFVISFTN